MMKIMSALMAAAFLAGPQPPTSQPAQPPTPPTVAAPKTPPTQQPPPTRPPAEQIPAPTPTPTPVPEAPLVAPWADVDPDRRTAIALLDRVQTLVEEALADKSRKSTRAVGTSGKLQDKAGKVAVDRATLAEILAQVQQVKVMLQTRR